MRLILIRAVAGLAALLSASAAFGQCGTTLPGGTLCGNRTGSSGLNGPLTNPVLGIPGTSAGQIGFAGSASGTATLKAQAAAGTPTILLPNVSGTLVVGGSGSFAGTSPITVSFPAGVVTYAFDLTVANTFLAQQTDQGATTTSPGWYAQIAGDTFPRIRVGLNSTDIPSIAFGPGNAVRDTFIERVNAGKIRFGGPDAASPVAQTLRVQNVLAGTSNTAGADLTIQGSVGTGTGAGGAVNFQYSFAGSTGTSQNSLSTVMGIGPANQGSHPIGINFYPTANFNSNNGVQIGAGVAANGNGSVITCWDQPGPLGSPTTIINGQEMCSLGVYGWNGSAWAPAANNTSMIYVATETWTLSANGSGILFQATKNGTTIAQNELSINNGITALAASEFTKPGLGIGTINGENGIFDNGNRPFSANNLSIAFNGNLETDFTISNNSTGTNAVNAWIVQNSVGSGLFGVGGSGYTLNTAIQNRAFILSGTGLSGITFYSSGANPIDAYVNGSRVGGWTSSGAFQVGTGTLAIAAAKTLTVSNTLTLTGTDGSSVAFGAGGTVLYGNQTITLTGDTTGSGTTAITTTTSKVNGVAYGASPSTNTVPVVTGTNAVTYETVPVAAGGTNCAVASITCFNNITGFSAAGATGTTSTNLVFSASPTFTGTTTVATLAATTINAFTLGGTISGGGNNINNVIIGASTPLAGSFTTVNASTSVASVLHIGGSGTTGTTHEIRATSGTGTTEQTVFTGGTNGGTTWGTWQHGGFLTVGATASTGDLFTINGTANQGISVLEATGNTVRGGFRWNTGAGGYFFLNNTSAATTVEMFGVGGGFYQPMLTFGSTSAATGNNGEVGFAKISASGSAPTAGFLKIAAVAGTNAGTCKIIAYAGTSTTPVTVIDNVGAGC